jgi:3-isopropylmalate dehydrogenase
LELFANLRPVAVFPELADAGPLKADIVRGVDLLVVRELTGGLYFGARGRAPHDSGEQAFDTMIYSTGEIERVVRLAGRLARQRRGMVTSVDKANVLESSRLWRATAERVLRDEFSDVHRAHGLVDAAAMHLLRRPRDFDVIVTENMFGDILTDEASVLAGSLGMLPSASIGAGPLGVYEPVHGSAPDIAGRGLANPIGAILSAAMLCRHSLEWCEVADRIELGVASALRAGLRTADIATGEAQCSTDAFALAVVERIAAATCVA